MPGQYGALMEALQPDVSPEEFGALDLRVGRITEVAEFPEARRPAWKLLVDLGPLGVRRSSAQLTHYADTDLLGRLVVVAANLGVKRIAGFPSECLVLGAVGTDGKARLLTPDSGADLGDRIA